MKTKFFIAAALLLNATAFSQSVSSRNEASSGASASASSTASNASANGSLSSKSTASGNVNAGNKVEAASRATSEVKQSGEASLAATRDEARKDYGHVRQETEANDRTTAGVYAGSNGNVETQHNKPGSNASINTTGGLSARSNSGSATVKPTEVEVKGNNIANAGINTGSTRPKAKASGKVQARTATKASVSGGAKHPRMKTGVTGNISGRSALSIK